MPWTTFQINGTTEYHYTIPDDNFKLVLRPGYTAELKLRMPQNWLVLDTWPLTSLLNVETAQRISIEHAEEILTNTEASFSRYRRCIRAERRKKK